MDQFTEVYEQFKAVRNCISKSGPITRNKIELANIKLEEAENCYQRLNLLIDAVNKNIGTDLQDKNLDDIKILTPKCKQVYKEIKDICKQISESVIDEGSSKVTVKIEQFNMASFDIKVATGLLPLMNGSESVTCQLIDAIDMYESMIVEKDKALLIKFVLKTRLNQNAKMRLSQHYNSVDELLKDMRTHLLTKKSDTALSAKLNRVVQGQRSIESFANEIENLFVDLTISQANGDNAAYAVLKPINERIAIKRFADGLDNPRLSTIIAANKFTSLKDAIRSALDEEKTRFKQEHINNFN